jgi:hypothetical protein
MFENTPTGLDVAKTSLVPERRVRSEDQDGPNSGVLEFVTVFVT